MNLDTFGALMAEICVRSLVAEGRALRWTIIANPGAGGFTIGSRWKKHRAVLEAAAAGRANPLRADASPSKTALAAGGPGGSAGEGAKGPAGLIATGLIATGGAGHARRVTEALLKEAAGEGAEGGYPGAGRAGEGPFHLIITAGGDGTSLVVLTALFLAPGERRDNFAVLRLPMGTGNDGADAPALEEALGFLTGKTAVIRQRAVRLSTSTAGKGPFTAFNILSVGLDAFVTHMTNRMKGNLPGDSYKLWVDIASLLYDRIYRVGPMEVRALDGEGREVKRLTEKVLLMAVGESGHRTYGSRKRILPDDRNVCVVKQMSLLRKVALKGLFTTGEHIHKPESILFNARRVEFRGEYPILAQMDGESVLLLPEDFPCAIELTEPLVPILKRIEGEGRP
jgi:diacylglycerol kinase family enzyme